jgi:hypothetical protein
VDRGNTKGDAMKTRRDDDRANDITATECCACGDEGHTQQSGGSIAKYECVDGRTVEVCETCAEDIHRYGGVFHEANDMGADRLAVEEFEQLLVYVNDERTERGGKPLEKDQFGQMLPPIEQPMEDASALLTRAVELFDMPNGTEEIPDPVGDGVELVRRALQSLKRS